MQSNLLFQDRKASLFLQLDQHLPLYVRPTTIEVFNEELQFQIRMCLCIKLAQCSPPGSGEFCLSVNDGVLVFVDLRRESFLASLAGVSCATVPFPVVAVQDNVYKSYEIVS